MAKTISIGKYSLLIRFIAVFIPGILLVGGMLFVIYEGESKNAESVVETNEANNAELLKEILTADFDSVVSDLMYLAGNHGLRKLINGDNTRLDELHQDFLSFSSRKKLYDQVRYLNETGMETVRINFNKGNPSIVPTEKLQNKGKRYYFKDAFVLNKAEVFVSPLDLNIERDQIEQPLKPMIRFGTPVFDDNGTRKGIVLLNYFGAKMIRGFVRASRSAGEIMLLNADSFFLKGPASEFEWGFMYQDGKNRNFATAYPEAWSKIKVQESGAFHSPEGLFTFTTIKPLAVAHKSSTGSGEAFSASDRALKAKEYQWRIVSRVSPETLNGVSTRIKNKLIQLYILLVALAAIASWFLASYSIRQKKIQRELQLSALKLERSNKELESFAHVASHDLQEPLRKIVGFGNRLKDKYADSLGDQGKDYLERMYNATERMQRLIDGLLTYSRVTTKAQPFISVDLGNVIQEVVSDLEVRIESVNGEVEVNGLPTIAADPMQMRQLFQNLIGNALKFHRQDEAPVVKIDSQIIDGGTHQGTNGSNGNGMLCQITITDNGIGFDEQYAERIFGAFQRLHGRSEYEGSGIGLSICQKIVERHKGNIQAKSTEGEGATFIINLPLEHHEHPEKPEE